MKISYLHKIVCLFTNISELYGKKYLTGIPIKTQYIYCLYVNTYMIVSILSIFCKLSFSLYVATYVWIKSEVLDTGL